MMCRICFGEDGDKYVSPCKCSGTMKWVHQSCLDAWTKTCYGLGKVECPTCKTIFAGCSKPRTRPIDVRELWINDPRFNRERKRKIVRDIMMGLEEQ